MCDSLDEKLKALMGDDLEEISPQMALRLGYLQLREEQAQIEAEEQEDVKQEQIDVEDLHERDIFIKGYENNQED